MQVVADRMHQTFVSGVDVKCSLWRYRLYTFYSTDVDIGIQTVIQTVVICGTDVQTDAIIKGSKFETTNTSQSVRLYHKSQRSV